MVACPTCGGYVPPSDGGGGFPVRNAMLDDAMKGGAVGGAEGRRDADVLRAMVRRAAEGDVARYRRANTKSWPTGLSPAQYSLWLDRHSEGETLAALGSALEAYESRVRSDTDRCAAYRAARLWV